MEGPCTQDVPGKVQKQAGIEERRGRQTGCSSHLGEKAEADDTGAFGHGVQCSHGS